MKKAFFGVGIITILFISVTQFFYFSKNREGRYYTGIGIKFVDDSKMGLRVLGVLKGGPAERAGLKFNDVITYIDGKRTKQLGTDGFTRYIKELKGKEKIEWVIVLDILRKKEKNTKFNHIVLAVMLAKIDNAAWTPLDAVFGSRISVGENRFAAEAKVYEDKKTGEFVYWHKIVNLSKKDIYVRWKVLNNWSIPLFNWFATMIPVHLRAGESKEFIFKSNLAPNMVSDEPVSFSTNRMFLGSRITIGATGFVPFYRN